MARRASMTKARTTEEDIEVEANETKGGLGIQSVEIGMDVLAALAGEGGPRSLSHIGRLCDMSRTKAHRYLTSLERSGFVEREPGTGHYRLGAKSVEVGLAALAGLDFPRFGSELLPEICRDVGESVFVSVWGDRGATIVRWEDSGSPVTVNVRVGSTMPLVQSATGQIFGAYLPEDITAPFVADELKRGLGNAGNIRTVRDAQALFARVRRSGMSLIQGSMLPSIAAVCAPVFDNSGKLVGGLTSLGLMGNFDPNPEGRTVRTVLDWAHRLSARLGARV